MDFDEYKDIKLPNGLNITENRLYEAMQKIGLNPEPQYPISQMKVDFAFPEEMLVIEINGVCHETEEQKIIDKKRWFVLNNLGWKRRTFTAKQVHYYSMEVAHKIKKLLGEEDEEQKSVLDTIDKREQELGEERRIYWEKRNEEKIRPKLNKDEEEEVRRRVLEEKEKIMKVKKMARLEYGREGKARKSKMKFPSLSGLLERFIGRFIRLYILD